LVLAVDLAAGLALAVGLAAGLALAVGLAAGLALAVGLAAGLALAVDLVAGLALARGLVFTVFAVVDFGFVFFALEVLGFLVPFVVSLSPIPSRTAFTIPSTNFFFKLTGKVVLLFSQHFQGYFGSIKSFLILLFLFQKVKPRKFVHV
jgi:hypothetical protein